MSPQPLSRGPNHVEIRILEEVKLERIRGEILEADLLQETGGRAELPLSPAAQQRRPWWQCQDAQRGRCGAAIHLSGGRTGVNFEPLARRAAG
jgi:hypothetical protein